MSYLFTKLDPYLRNSMDKPKIGVSLNTYIRNLQEKATVWEDMYRPNPGKKTYPSNFNARSKVGEDRGKGSYERKPLAEGSSYGNRRSATNT